MKVIDVDVVIANLFALGMQKVSIEQLKVLCANLERSFHPSFYVNRDSNTLIAITQSRPDMFRWKEDSIYRGSWSDPKKYIRDHVSQMHIPKESRPKVEQCLLSLLDSGLADDFQRIFSQEYVDKNYNWQVPDEIRKEFLSMIKAHYESWQSSPD